MKKSDLEFIQSQIGYKFKNPYLLMQAFTRRSYSEENGGEDNEVLEFIGDKVLDFFVVKFLIIQNSNSAKLYNKFIPRYGLSAMLARNEFPEENTFICQKNEAELTDIKKLLVQKKTLASRIDALGIGDLLLMGKGDIQNNANQTNSVKEDLFEALIGAVAIDSNWDMKAMESTVEIMLDPESILLGGDDEDYVHSIQEWALIRTKSAPIYHFKEGPYSSSFFDGFSGITQQPISLDATEMIRVKFHCFLKLTDDLLFRGFGETKTEARRNVCKLAYDHLCKNGCWLSIRDEIEDPNEADAINQLEILASRGYFDKPVYDFSQTYDANGNPVWKCKCYIEKYNKHFSSKPSSSKKSCKKKAAFKMLTYVLEEEE